MVTLREITKDNINTILNLKVKANQIDQVASNGISIAEGCYAKNAWFRAIYAEEVPVGFIMLDIDHQKLEYYVWRLMIDQHQQGKGYGAAGLNLAIDYIRTFPAAKNVILSYVPKEEGDALPFYHKLGFKETGEIDEGEVMMSKSL